MCQPPPYPPPQRKIDHWQYCQCCYPQLTPMTSLSVRNFMEFMEILSGATGCIFCFVWRVYCDIPATPEYLMDFTNMRVTDTLVLFTISASEIHRRFIFGMPLHNLIVCIGMVGQVSLYLMFLKLTFNIMYNGRKIRKRKEKVIVQKDRWW